MHKAAENHIALSLDAVSITRRKLAVGIASKFSEGE
jgi:hypothetical protein